MKVKKSKAIEAYIPTSSMADIAFLLIIFFMVSTVFPVDKTQVDLPDTEEVKKYDESSAVITVTSEELATLREKVDTPISELYGRSERLIVKTSDGEAESALVFDEMRNRWDISQDAQYTKLKDQMQQFIEAVENRRVALKRETFVIVLKADAKVPFKAVDGVIQVLQDIGGETAQNMAILSQPTK